MEAAQCQMEVLQSQNRPAEEEEPNDWDLASLESTLSPGELLLGPADRLMELDQWLGQDRLTEVDWPSAEEEEQQLQWHRVQQMSQHPQCHHLQQQQQHWHHSMPPSFYQPSMAPSPPSWPAASPASSSSFSYYTSSSATSSPISHGEYNSSSPAAAPACVLKQSVPNNPIQAQAQQNREILAALSPLLKFQVFRNFF
jgi:hypothetical protein